ncbi:MAG: hypothetical protein M3R61_00135 [Chloroflexota bacterium]|nr:hypothetical protein [Chloroflexota bacterium]
MADTEIVALVAETQPAAARAVALDDAASRLALIEKELKEARSEAAKYRTSLRSQEQAQADAEATRLKEAGEFKALYEQEQQARTELEAQVAQAHVKQLQLDACIAAGLPPSMAARLMGATAEELAQDAKALAEHFKATPPSTGASNPASVRGQTQVAQFDPKHPPKLSSIDWKK